MPTSSRSKGTFSPCKSTVEDEVVGSRPIGCNCDFFFLKKACLYVDTFLSLAINLNIYINLFHCGGKTEMPTKMDNIAFCRFG